MIMSQTLKKYVIEFKLEWRISGGLKAIDNFTHGRCLECDLRSGNCMELSVIVPASMNSAG